MIVLSCLTAMTVMADPARGDWYRHSLVTIHCDNHSGLLGRGLTVDQLTAMFATIPAEMIQVSAQSNQHATYPTQVGLTNPDAGGYDTLAVFREVTRRLGRRFCVYMSVDRRPLQLKDHPEWGARDAKGEQEVVGDPIVCNRPNPERRGYLYEQFIPQIEEIIARYDPDGFWFDGDYILTRPCWCANCLAEWQRDTGEPAPRRPEDPGWDRWVAWHLGRYREYRRQVAEAIHRASPKALYTSNWSWAWTPEPVPDFVDTLSGDAWNIKQVHCVTQRWGAQQQTPWDIMSYCVAQSRTYQDYSLQRTLQEGALTMAAGGVWFLWGFAGDVPEFGVRTTRAAAEFLRDREAALGPSVSLAHVAVLDSETAMAAGGPTGIDGPAHSIARALAESCYLTDLVNEATWLAHATPYRVLVLPGCRQVAPAVATDVRRFVADGGILLVCGGALLGGAAGPDEIADLLGGERKPADRAQRRLLRLGRERQHLGGLYDLTPAGAEVTARFEDGTPAVARHPVGRGLVGYFASDELRYPDDALYADVLRRIGVGPSYTVSGAGDAAILCSLRRRGEDVVLHAIDLTTRIGGANVDVDTPGLTDWNPPRSVTITLAAPAPTTARALPEGVFASTAVADGVVRIGLNRWQTHAAAILRFPDAAIDMLPADTPLPANVFHPESERPGVVFRDGFENLPDGARPASPWQPQVRGQTNIIATTETAAEGGRCLKFIDAPDSSFWPFLHRTVPAFRHGRARLSFALRVEPRAACNIELRYEGRGPGPSLVLDGDGRLSLGGRQVATLAPGEWHRFTVTVRLGGERDSFDLQVVSPDGATLELADQPYASEWFFLCNAVYFVGVGREDAAFYLDDVTFERL